MQHADIAILATLQETLICGNQILLRASGDIAISCTVWALSLSRLRWSLSGWNILKRMTPTTFTVTPINLMPLYGNSYGLESLRAVVSFPNIFIIFHPLRLKNTRWVPRGKQRLPHSRLTPSCYLSTQSMDSTDIYIYIYIYIFKREEMRNTPKCDRYILLYGFRN